MESHIWFLNELREDLLEAAWRESVRPERKRRRRMGLRSWSRRRIIGLAVAVVLVASAGTGYLAMGRTGRYRSAAKSVTLNPGSNPRSQSRLQVGFQDPFSPAPPLPVAPGGADYESAPTSQRLADTASHVTSSDTFGATQAASGTGAPLPAIPSLPQVSLTKIIKTANMSVVVPRGDFSAAYREATGIASQFGGYVQSSATSGTRSGTLKLEIPSKDFETALGELRMLGTVETESVNGQDVTAQFVDLGARLKIALAREAALLRMMQHASGIQQTLQLENVLNDTQTQVEQLKGQLRVLRSQTSLGSVTIDLREQGVKVATKGATVTNPSVSKGLHQAIAGLLGVVIAILVGLGYLLPIGIVAGVLYLIWRKLRAKQLVIPLD